MMFRKFYNNTSNSKYMFCPKCFKITLFYWNNFKWVCFNHEKGKIGR